MKKSLAICLVALCVTARSHAGSSDFKTFMQGVVPKVAHAFETKDVKFFDKITTPDFTESQGGRVITRAQSMSAMRQQFTMAKAVKCRMKLLSATSSGAKGTATTQGDISIVTGPDPKGKSHVFGVVAIEKETWVRTSGGWKLRSIDDSKASKMTLDGKPVGGGGH